MYSEHLYIHYLESIIINFAILLLSLILSHTYPSSIHLLFGFIFRVGYMISKLYILLISRCIILGHLSGSVG